MELNSCHDIADSDMEQRNKERRNDEGSRAVCEPGSSKFEIQFLVRLEARS
jgi:hypothetical protein